MLIRGFFSSNMRRFFIILSTLMVMLVVQPSWALPDEVEMDRYILAIGKYIDQGDYPQAEKYIKKVSELSIEPPPLYHYYEAMVASRAKLYDKERKALEKYISRAGKDAEHYQEVLLRITELEESTGEGKAQNPDEALIDAFRQNRIDDDQAYVKKLQELYLEQEPVDAIIAHVNQLLATHAYTGQRVKKAGDEYRLLYSVSSAQKGNIVLVEKDRAHSPERITSSKTNVYGQSPFINHLCVYERSSCVIKKPDGITDWIKIGYSEEAASELSEALTRLIHFLQR